MKILPAILFCLAALFVNAQKKDSTLKALHIDLGKEYTFSVKPVEEKTDNLKYISTFLPLLVIAASLIGIAMQVNTRRKDERLKNQLDRLNVQISDFYGPLFTLYESGDQNFYTYLKHFGTKADFRNPHFKNWSYAVFQPTNAAIEDIIVNKSDLILGKKIPPCLLKFCAWSATMKVYLQAQMQSNFDITRWQQIIDETEHPQMDMQAYLRASFEVLKEEQNALLLGKRTYVKEEELIQKVSGRSIKYKDKSKKEKESIEHEAIIKGLNREDIWKIAEEMNQNVPAEVTNPFFNYNYTTSPISL